jgi:predicted flap endonuclease-1-like 5' DNA nuclease
VAASPSVVPRAPATPPPPPLRPSSNPGLSRPSVSVRSGGATAQLEQRLGATQVELRKLGSERHTLRARLRREADRVRELESALRAEKELRRHATDEHSSALSGLRQRLVELETARDAELARLNAELARLNAELEQARQALTAAEARAVGPSSSAAAAARSTKQLQGLRRIRGIGPGYQRLLEQLGVTRVQQVATWSAADIVSFADKLRIKPERITKDDWVGQAKALEPDPED